MANTTPFPLGFFGSNPNGNDSTAMAQFEQQYDQFTALMGARPAFMDGYVDFSQDPSQWASNAGWTAWSWAMSGDNYVGPGSGTTPVIGIPMASTAGDNSSWYSVDQFYQQIIAGNYDADYAGVVQAWAQQGYTTMQARIGYEFNGNFMSWAPGNSASPTVNADFVAAWQHIADVMHTAGQAAGITVQTVWNPADSNWSATPPGQLYPGDQYVDVIGTDAYSPTWANDLTNWSSAGADATVGPQAANSTVWAENATNREHYWQYPDGSQWVPTGTGAGWSLQDAITLAQQTGKPLAIEETGAGGDGGALGPNDDPAFASWLASALQQAQAAGVTIQNVNIWTVDEGDGDWGFLNGEKPAEASAWATHFGVPGATPASQYDAAGSNDTNLTAPGTLSVGSGQTMSLGQLVSISDAWAAANAGNVTIVVQANDGVLSGTDMAGNPLPTSGTPQITLTDSLANDMTELASLTYASPDGGADAITIDSINQAGNLDSATISINGGSPTLSNPLSGLGSTGGSGPGGTGPGNGATSYVNEAMVDQDLSGDGTQLMVSDVAPWSSASITNPIATEVNGDANTVIGTSTTSGIGYLMFANPVSMTDGTWGNNVAIASSAAPPVDLPAITLGTGSDALSLLLSEDAWQGDAQYTIAVDGQQIGGVMTETAPHGFADQTVNLLGDFSDGQTHNVSITFLDDAYGGTPVSDRNLYVDGASIDGTSIANSSLGLYNSGSQSISFSIAGSGPTGGTPVSLSPAVLQMVSLNNSTIVASGGQSVFLSGSGNTLTSTGGATAITALDGSNSITTSGSGNTIMVNGGGNVITAATGDNTIYAGDTGDSFVLPTAWEGQDSIYGVTSGDTFDLQAALAQTTWNGAADTLGNYLSLQSSNNGQDANVMLSATSNGTGSLIATLHGDGALTLASFLAQSQT